MWSICYFHFPSVVLTKFWISPDSSLARDTMSCSVILSVYIIYFSGLIIDVIVITVLKLTFRRSRPAHNQDDMVGAVTSVDKYSFPSGHATRAAMLTGFFVCHVCDSARHLIYIVLWSICVSLSRVALGRHHLIDVICGYIVGLLEYLILFYLWVPREICMQWLESYFSHFHL